VLVLFTSRSAPGAYSFAKVRDRLNELDIQLYVTAVQISSDVSGDSDRQTLRELAERSGGNAFFPSSIYEQADISKKIMAQLKNQYLMGYRSTNRASDGKWRKIKITGEVRDNTTKKVTKLTLRAKPGYYAPTAAK
jgi:Ca-activated chloride channel family protein